MLSNLDNPRGTDSHLIGHAFSEPAGLIRGMGLSDACAKSIESTDSVPANCAIRNCATENEVVVGACPLLELGSKAEPPTVARTVGTSFPAALRPYGAGALC